MYGSKHFSPKHPRRWTFPRTLPRCTMFFIPRRSLLMKERVHVWPFSERWICLAIKYDTLSILSALSKKGIKSACDSSWRDWVITHKTLAMQILAANNRNLGSEYQDGVVESRPSMKHFFHLLWKNLQLTHTRGYGNALKSKQKKFEHTFRIDTHQETVFYSLVKREKRVLSG